jgi:DCN1-like protein 1/2
MQDDDDDNEAEDVNMDEGVEGWKEEHLQWWFDFLNERGGKGVTKDTWVMVCTPTNSPSPRNFTYSWHSIIKFFAFIRSIDAKFSKYNPNGV